MPPNLKDLDKFDFDWVDPDTEWLEDFDPEELEEEPEPIMSAQDRLFAELDEFLEREE